MQVIKRAERLPNGRVKGVGPPRLVMRVIGRIGPVEKAKVQEIHLKRRELDRQMKALLVSLGLDPHKQYKFTTEGDVVEIGNWKPIYD